ncbi:MAG: BlaI/MecI/CopY family transcriptional regulator [Chloroflexota bacterium]|nr:BlaI/MecI/CopY family transcriptional regulator [Chloroflexota bacterium]
MAEEQTEQTDLRRAPRVLGALEARLMNLLWGTPDRLSVQDICDRLDDGHNYKTVMTVLNRLVEKELLVRELDGRAYRYRPQMDRAAFLRSVADSLVRSYEDAYGSEGRPYLQEAVNGGEPHAPHAAPFGHPARARQAGASLLALLLGVLLALIVTRAVESMEKRSLPGG